MLGWLLAGGFALLELPAPGSISLPGADGPAPSLTTWIYVGFVTLTTTGYGDVVPLSPAAEGLAAVGALIGIIYPAALVARLVSLYRGQPVD